MKAKTFLFPTENYQPALDFITSKLATARYVEGPIYTDAGECFALFYNNRAIHCVDFKISAETDIGETGDVSGSISIDIPFDAKKLEGVKKKLFAYYRRNRIPHYITITNVEQAEKLFAPKARHLWKAVGKYPAPDNHIVLLHENSGQPDCPLHRYGTGYFSGGVQMEMDGTPALWTAIFWTEPPLAPNSKIGNYLD